MSNPFEVLRLDPTTPNEEIVRQAGRLRQRATDEDTVAAIRQAVQALTGRSEERRLHEGLTHPSPCYHWPNLDRFVATFRRPPSSAGASSADAPILHLAEFATLLRPLTPVALDATAPQPHDLAAPPEEISAQTIQALWQCLLFDMRA